MIRNYPLVALCALPIALRNIDESGWRIRSRSALAFAVVITALIGVSVVTNQIYDQAGIGGRKFGLEVPAGYQRPVEFFRAAGVRGPLFNNFDIGSYLIWKLPEEPVFIDGRPVCLDTVTGMTDGTPPGVVKYIVVDPAQDFVEGAA